MAYGGRDAAKNANSWIGILWLIAPRNSSAATGEECATTNTARLNQYLPLESGLNGMHTVIGGSEASSRRSARSCKKLSRLCCAWFHLAPKHDRHVGVAVPGPVARFPPVIASSQVSFMLACLASNSAANTCVAPEKIGPIQVLDGDQNPTGVYYSVPYASDETVLHERADGKLVFDITESSYPYVGVQAKQDFQPLHTVPNAYMSTQAPLFGGRPVPSTGL